jgi:hypothetical protein
MKAFVVGLLLFGLAGSAAGAQSSDAAGPGADRVLSLLGAWNCQSGLGSEGRWTFTQRPNGTIAMTNRFVTQSGERDELDESYSFDRTSGKWYWSTKFPGHPEVAETGEPAEPWTGTTWIIDGSRMVKHPQHDNGIKVTHPHFTDMRVVFTSLDANGFQREIQVPVPGGWVAKSSSICRRDLAYRH